MAVDPVAAARYFVQELGCTAFPVWGSRNGRCNCGDPHDGTGKFAPENVGKHPATNNGFKDATGDTAAITRFLSNPGTPNYGLNAPPGILVIDVDGPEGLAKWEALQHEHGPLPVTLTTTTANGRHYFYRWPESAGPMPKGKLFGFVVRRHDDGYVIGPGSIHPSGVTYDTLRQPNGHPYGIADLPGGWAAAALEATRVPMDAGTITVDAGGYQVPEPGYDGTRYDEIVRYTASRYIRGLTKDEIWAGVVDVLAPRFAIPLTDAELRSRFERAWANTPQRLGPPRSVVQDEQTGEVKLVAEGRGMLDAPEAERFPEPPHPVALGGLLGDLVRDLSEGTDASEVALLGSLLAFCGVLLPARGHFGRPQTNALYVGLVGVSGESRKGTSMTRVQGALGDMLGYHVPAQALLDGVNSGEGLVTALETKQLRFRSEPTAGILFEEEFDTLLTAQGRDGSSLDSRMRAAWDGGPLSNRKQSGSQTVDPPYWLAALVAITPTELQEKAPANATSSGSFNRWLWLPVNRRDIEVLDTPPIVTMSVRRAFTDAYEAAQNGRPEVRMTPDAQRLLSAYARHLAATTFGLEADLSRRLVPNAYRIGMTHAVAEGSHEVNLEHIDRGVAVTEYARSGIHWVFGFTVGDPYATLMLRHLQALGPMTKHDITQEITRDPIKKQRAIDELVRLGFAELVKVATTGRPRHELRLRGSRHLFTPFVHLGVSATRGER